MKRVVIRVFILWSLVILALLLLANQSSQQITNLAMAQQLSWLERQQIDLLQKLRNVNWAEANERRHVIAELSSLPSVSAVRVITHGNTLDAFEPSKPIKNKHTIRMPVIWESGLVEVDINLDKFVPAVSQGIGLFEILTVTLLMGGLAVHWWMVQPVLRLEDKSKAILSGNLDEEQFSDVDTHPLTSHLSVNLVLNEYQKSKRQQTDLSNRLRQHSFVDELTGLGNRDYFDAELEVHLSQEVGSVHGAVVLFSFEPLLELQQEKRSEFNSLIQQVGDFFHRFVDEEDLCWVARRDHVDFALLTLEHAPDKVRRLCQQIVRDLQRSVFDSTEFKNHFINVGVTFFSSGDKSYDVLASADMSLRHAQLEGENRVHMYTPKKLSRDVIKGGVRWRSFLQSILEKRKVTLFYQSQISEVYSDQLSYEVLSRIEDKGKMIAASVFLPMANRCGLASDFDRLTIDKALKEMAFSEQFTDVKLSINVFSESLLNKEFVSWLVQRIGGLPELTHRIYFEVSESAVSRALDKLKEPIKKIAELGCHWCVEHVGSPCADLSYITDLPLSRLKLAQATVRNIEQHQDKELFVQSLITAAHQAGLEVWAEGVESEAEWLKLVELGVTGGQGYWFGSPQSSLYVEPKAIVNQ